MSDTTDAAQSAMTEGVQETTAVARIIISERPLEET